jgi:hypothetical protein
MVAYAYSISSDHDQDDLDRLGLLNLIKWTG